MIWDVIFWGVIISIIGAILLELFYFIVIAPAVYESVGFWGLLIYVLTTLFSYIWDFVKYIIGIVIVVLIIRSCNGKELPNTVPMEMPKAVVSKKSE